MKTVRAALPVVLVWVAVGVAHAQPGTVFPGADWQQATPASQGVDAARLAAAVDFMDRNFGPDGARELAIIRNGTLIWRGPQADAYHKLSSVTKVFTSTVLALMVGDGKCTLDTLAAEHWPALDDQHPAYARIKLRHLASMTGGYNGATVQVEDGQKWGDPMGYIAAAGRPEFEPPGSQIAYNDHDVHLLGWLLARYVAHEPLKDVFQRRLAGPIGMTRWDWGASGTSEGMVHYNAAGTPALKGDGGVVTAPLDLARLGHLYLNGGRWGDRQLLPAEFVAAATGNQIPPDLPGRSRSFLAGAYGFYWWTNGVMANGKRRWPSAPAGAYTAHGASTNFCLVVPEWRMVIARMGTEAIPGSLARQDELWDGFLARLGEALTPAGARAPAVTGFTLINADTDQPITSHDPLVDGAIVDLGALPTRRLNIRANTDPATVGSVRFAYDGDNGYRLEYSPPYALGGDEGGDYEAWILNPGMHTLTATAYARPGGEGQAGAALAIKFQVVAKEATVTRQTSVSIVGDQWHINGQPTYAGRTWQGHRIEGLLLNSRMVQGIFDDLNPDTRKLWAYPDTGVWDPERNTREFLAAMPQWRARGLLAFTINLQGGSPQGYSNGQPWHNSALTATGELRPEYMARLQRILDRADELGMAVILGVFYFGQDERLRDEGAVVRALDNAVQWVLDRDYRNVVIEVNNECDVRYDHAILQPERVHELIERVKTHRREGRRLLVSTSYGGGSIPSEGVVRTADFVLIHGNGVDDPNRIAAMVRRTRQVPGYRPMPILFNEDDHFDFDQPMNNMVAAIAEYASWGYFDPGTNNYADGFQCPPVQWELNTERKRGFFAKVEEMTGE